MYLAYAAASAVFAGLTAVLAKIGVKDMDSTLGHGGAHGRRRSICLANGVDYRRGAGPCRP